MKHERATFYVGLHSPVDPLSASERRRLVIQRDARVRAIIARGYEAATFARVDGMWRGLSEPTLRIETIQPADERERERARALARELRAELEQEAVGLTFEPVAFELI